MEQKICAIVVTYNRKNLLIECLRAIINQSHPPDAIYLVNNASTDQTTEFLQELGYLPKESQTNMIITCTIPETRSKDKKILLHYIQLSENLGGAGGFHYGMKSAMELGYQATWLLDDDGVPDKDTLKNLYGHLTHDIVPCSLVVAKDDTSVLSFGLRIYGRSYYTVQEVIIFANSESVLPSPSGNFFNSILIPRIIIEKIGYPTQDFFIWGDEMEYYFRMLTHHFSIITVCNSRHFHPKNTSNQTVGWKYYYIIRNSIFLLKKYPKYGIIPFRSLIKVLLRQSWKRKNICFVLRGLWDGLLGKTGKRVSP